MAVGLWDDVKDLGSAALHVAEDVYMAPAKIAHWVLSKMFGDPDAELEKFAAELTEMAQQVEELGKEINSSLSRLSWHGAAADAFVAHAQGRVRELNGVSDELGDLSSAIKRLADEF